MELKATGVITGFTKFQGEFDGQKVDANTVYVEVEFGDMGKGRRTAPRKCKDESVIKKVEHLNFPIQAEMTMSMTATSRKESLVIIDIKPLAVTKAAA